MKKILFTTLLGWLMVFTIGFIMFYFENNFPLWISLIASLIVATITVTFVELMFYSGDKKKSNKMK